MKKLLLNGCSFGECWRPTGEFITGLGCDETVNISKIATSFQRTCRSTVEWVAQNGNPFFVIIPITFAHRWELAIKQHDDQLDGAWFPLQRKEFLDEYQNELYNDLDVDKLKKMLDLYYGSIPTIKTFWDKLFTEIIMLSSFLHAKGIKHLFFDMCNNFDKKHIKGYKGFEKLNLINENPNVIDIFSFCGNKHMYNTLSSDSNIDFNIHHAPEQYKHLEKYLLDYINR